MKSVGILHPGEMGVSVAASARQSGNDVYWASQGRGEKTRLRAERQGLIDVGSISELCHSCEIILSVCPPHSAEEIAKSVLDHGFTGFYLDANAISPQRTSKIGRMMEANNVHFIDGGIIGGPAWKPNETWLYLSGTNAGVIAECFSGGLLETKIIGDEIGKASALKMCYAAYTKGTTALLSAILAAAESLGVRDELYQQWEMDDPGFPQRTHKRTTGVTAKAWRFEGEMHEIASTSRDAGLPGGFHEAAAEIYRRMAGFKGSAETPVLEDVLSALVK
jgi:3-hydroxyisobutyrate dehydrogenase-like beta-hydroxyacid dehydrogenase